MQHLEVTFKNGEVYYYPADERGWASGVRGGRRYLLVGYAMIPADEAERWRLVDGADRPLIVERCASVMDRGGVPGEAIRCVYEAGHESSFVHAARDRAGNELRWTDPPDIAGVEEVAHDGDHERRPCPAMAWLRGVGYPCGRPASYPHTVHGNADAGLMWPERTS